jgi:hypothetical protein
VAFSSGGVLDTIADKYTGVIEFQISLGIYRISKKSAELLLKKRDTWPVLMFQKIAIQVVLPRLWIVLSQQTIATMRATISDFYTEQQLSLARPSLVLQG